MRNAVSTEAGLNRSTYQFGRTSFSLSGPGDDPWFELLLENFAALDQADVACDLNIQILVDGDGYWLINNSVPATKCIAGHDLLYEVEGVVVTQAQLAHPELIFLHAAALWFENQGCLLVGNSGAGKSTLCWALSHFGFNYLSDELAPLSQYNGRFLAHPYRHAICLKQEPAAPFQLPEGVLDSGHTWHIPVNVLACSQHRELAPISRIFFVKHSRSAAPETTPLTRSAAAHQLYPHILNALAHPAKGLPAAIGIATAVSSFALTTSNDLDATCKLVRQAMRSASGETQE